MSHHHVIITTECTHNRPQQSDRTTLNWIPHDYSLFPSCSCSTLSLSLYQDYGGAGVCTCASLITRKTSRRPHSIRIYVRTRNHSPIQFSLGLATPHGPETKRWLATLRRLSPPKSKDCTRPIPSSASSRFHSKPCRLHYLLRNRSG